MKWLDVVIIITSLISSVGALRYRYRARYYQRRYQAGQRSNAQLHDAIFHLRRHLERCQSLQNGTDRTQV